MPIIPVAHGEKCYVYYPGMKIFAPTEEKLSSGRIAETWKSLRNAIAPRCQNQEAFDLDVRSLSAKGRSLRGCHYEILKQWSDQLKGPRISMITEKAITESVIVKLLLRAQQERAQMKHTSYPVGLSILTEDGSVFARKCYSGEIANMAKIKDIAAIAIISRHQETFFEDDLCPGCKEDLLRKNPDVRIFVSGIGGKYFETTDIDPYEGRCEC